MVLCEDSHDTGIYPPRSGVKGLDMGRSLLDSVAVYRVKGRSRATGAERFVNTEPRLPRSGRAGSGVR